MQSHLVPSFLYLLLELGTVEELLEDGRSKRRRSLHWWRKHFVSLWNGPTPISISSSSCLDGVLLQSLLPASPVPRRTGWPQGCHQQTTVGLEIWQSHHHPPRHSRQFYGVQIKSRQFGVEHCVDVLSHVFIGPTSRIRRQLCHHLEWFSNL